MPPTHLIMINSVSTEPADNITFISKPTTHGEIRAALDTCFSNAEPGTDFIVFLRAHGGGTSTRIGFDTTSNSKLFIIYGEELTTPILKARSEGHVVLGVLQMCYGGNNKLLTGAFDMAVGSTVRCISNPIHSEKIVVDFMNNESRESISKNFKTKLYSDYSKLGNQLADAWGDSCNGRSVWELYENS
jgi:hypothetical protein